MAAPPFRMPMGISAPSWKRWVQGRGDRRRQSLRLCSHLASHQRRFHSRRPRRGSRPDDRLRFGSRRWPPLSPADGVPPASPTRVFHNRMREMAAAQGFTEVYNYSFLSDDQARAFGFDPTAQVHGRESHCGWTKSLLRPSLATADREKYRRQRPALRSFPCLFEIGREIHPDGEIPQFAAAAIFSKDDGVGQAYSS